MATTINPSSIESLDIKTVTMKHRGHVRRAAVEGILFLAMAVAASLLMWGSNFAKDMVHDQLADQQIAFPVKGADNFKPEDYPTLQKYGSESKDKLNYVDSGAEAKAYANDYIAKHISDGAAVVDGKTYTYATMGAVQAQLRTQVADLKAKNDPTAADVQKKLDAVNGQRETLFKGETLRGLLLYAWGWSLVGSIAGIVAWVAFLGAAVLLLLTIWGFVQARRDHAAMVAMR